MTAAVNETRSGMSRLYSMFGRVTSSGRFIPLIDGLRFIAIAAVFFYHLNDYLVHKREWTAEPAVTQSVLYQTLNVGGCGVPLFFAISGFILGLPFLEKIEQRRPLSLKSYFLRRVTRLEPPYIINLLLVTLLLVIVKGSDWKSLLGPLAASTGYVHNLVYGEMSRINFVAWSLEVEVQFYLLAPLIALALYSLPTLLRRLVFGTLIAGTAVVKSVWFQQIPAGIGLSILGQYEHFLVGMLLADFFHSDWERSPRRQYLFDLIGVAAWWGVVAVNWSPTTRALLPLATFIAYFCTFRGRLLSTILSHPLLTTIGGMCYTMYLYHFFIISLIGRFALRMSAGATYPMQLILLTVFVAPVALVICGLLFIGIEKPFMVWRPFQKKSSAASGESHSPLSSETSPAPSTCST